MRFTTEELTTRWEDLRAIENLMGRRAFYEIQCEEEFRFSELWSSRDDICLGFNHGYYQGRSAVLEYYDSQKKRTELKTKLIQKAYPDKLGDKSLEELYGVGIMKSDNLTNPLVELAEDGLTAKGLWSMEAFDIDLHSSGHQARWKWGRAGADFIKEGGVWKLWHLVIATEFDIVMGADIHKEYPPFEANPLYEEIDTVPLPEPNVPRLVYESYSLRRPVTEFPPVPVAYGTFADTFSYGV